MPLVWIGMAVSVIFWLGVAALVTMAGFALLVDLKESIWHSHR